MLKIVVNKSIGILISLVPPARLERAAHGLGIRCSIHLSYGGFGMVCERYRE